MTDDQRAADSHIDYKGEYEHPTGETYTLRMRRSTRRAMGGILAIILVYLLALAAGVLPHRHASATHSAAHSYVPPLWAVIPFIGLLLAIAVLPLISTTANWWHHNKNRFLVASLLGLLTLGYYGFSHPGGIANHFTHAVSSSPGLETLFAAFSNAIFSEFIPFIVLLFSLYVISGGINLSGDLPARPTTNLGFLGLGTLLASFIGTTGAAMVLIRPLLTTNLERRYKTHTVVFFIFTTCNCAGLLLPIGDPPLFLGYLRGVPFTWTLKLWPYWIATNLALLAIYFVWDTVAYRKETLRDLIRDEVEVRPLRVRGLFNLVYLLGVVLCVALIVPDQPFMGTSVVPPVFFREMVMLFLVLGSLLSTHSKTRVDNRFDYVAIIEVAALFCGIFICMQVPIEILNIRGQSLGIDSAAKFFWATGVLSSFLDNAPTYVVFLETAVALPADGLTVILGEGRQVLDTFLVSISLGAVFMGANTYIGNGPNFMVRSIAEQAGVKMPSFFGYMVYSFFILIPIFAIVTYFLPVS